jgi:hypothetical protein
MFHLKSIDRTDLRMTNWTYFPFNILNERGNYMYHLSGH